MKLTLHQQLMAATFAGIIAIFFLRLLSLLASSPGVYKRLLLVYPLPY